MNTKKKKKIRCLNQWTFVMVTGFSGASVNIHLFYVFVIFCSWTCCNVSHNMAKRRWYMSRDNSSREICQNDHDLWPESRKDQKKGKTLTQTCLSVQLCWWIFWIIWQESCKAGLQNLPSHVFIPLFFNSSVWYFGIYLQGPRLKGVLLRV